MNTPPINIEALMVLDAIEYRGSYAAAAEQLNKVPSALSYIVQKLEEQLNVTIFVRQGRRAVLTPAGKHLLLEGRKVLNAINLLSEQTQTIANGWEPKIRVACDSIIDIQPVFTGIASFLAEHENIEIDVQEEVMNGSWEALVADRVDLVIGAPEPIPALKGIRAVKMGAINLVLVAGANHELSHMTKPIEASNLTRYRTVVVHDSVRNEIARTVNLIEGSNHFFVSSIKHKLAAIMAGIGIGYLPKALIQNEIDNGELMIVETVEQIPSQDLFLAWKIANKGKGLFKLRRLLENHLLESR